MGWAKGVVIRGFPDPPLILRSGFGQAGKINSDPVFMDGWTLHILSGTGRGVDGTHHPGLDP